MENLRLLTCNGPGAPGGPLQVEKFQAGMRSKILDRYFRLLFAYTEAVMRTPETVGPGALRCELSHRNRARTAGCAAEMSYSPVPSIIYGEDEAGEHGNFLTASYKRILQQPA